MKILAMIMTVLCLMAGGDVNAQERLESEPSLRFNVTQMQSVEQDLLTASLRIEVEADTPQAVQTRINQAMTEAISLADKNEAIKVKTLGYNVYKYEPRKSRDDTGQAQTVWRGSQGVNLESLDSAAVLNMSGKLQNAGFLMNGLSYSLSDAKRREVEDALLIEALEALETKAVLAAGTLKFSGYEIETLAINPQAGIYPPSPVFEARTMSLHSAESAMPAPVASAGESTVEVTLSAEITLIP